MEYRLFDFDKDYEKICGWYQKWGYTSLKKEMMPQRGIVVSNEGHDIAAVWLYVTDGKIGLLEGVVIDPDSPKSRRKGWHRFVLDTMEPIAKAAGCLDLWVISKDDSITAACKDAGFLCLEKDFKVLIKGV